MFTTYLNLTPKQESHLCRNRTFLPKNCNLIISNPEEFFGNCYMYFNLGITVINYADRVKKKIITGICLKMVPKNAQFRGNLAISERHFVSEYLSRISILELK